MIQIFDDLKHSDFVLDHYGDSWLVNSDWRGIFASRLKDGRVKKIWPRAEELIEKGKSKSLDGKPVDKPPYVTMSGHISRVSSIPGLILVYRHFDGGMYFIDIDEPEWTSYAGNAYLGPRAPEGKNGRMESQPWGITSQGEVTWYYREPRASSSQSGEFIFFNSDFGYYDNYSPEPPLKAFTHIIDMNSSID
jgi:hypothetical protein